MVTALANVFVGFVVAIGQPMPPATNIPSPTSEKLAKAFPGVDFSNATTKLTINSDRGVIVVAATEAKVEADGRLRLTNFAVAMFPKNSEALQAQPTTVRSEYALVKFDRPIRDVKDSVERKLISVELAVGLELRLAGQ